MAMQCQPRHRKTTLNFSSLFNIYIRCFVFLVSLLFISPRSQAQQLSQNPPSAQWTRYPVEGPTPSRRTLAMGDIDLSSNRYLVYAGGEGQAGIGNIFNDLWVFDLSSGYWEVFATAGEQLAAPNREGCTSGSLVIISGVALLFGGEDANTMFDRVLQLDLTTHAFNSNEIYPRNTPVPMSRKQHFAFVRADPLANNTQTMYIFGGNTVDQFLNDFWAYRPGNPILLTPSSIASNLNNPDTSGAWSEVAPSASDPGLSLRAGVVTGLQPPRMTLMEGVYDDINDALFVFHGRYEAFNLVDDPAKSLWRWTWANRTWMEFPMVEYVPATNSFQPFAPLSDACTWFYKGVIYRFGGGDDYSGLLFNGFHRLNASQGLLLSSVYDNTTGNFTGYTNAYGQGQQTPWVWQPVPIVLSPLTSANWDEVNNQMPERRGMDCHIAPNYPAMNITTPVLLLFGGQTYKGPSNDLLFFDLEAQSWLLARVDTLFPVPRSFHVSVTVGLSIYVHGGMDTALNMLFDFWVGTLMLSPSGEISTLSWDRAPVSSVTSPSPRAHHAATPALGQLYLFGGLGPQTGTQRNILQDLWQYNPRRGVWTLIQADCQVDPSTLVASTPLHLRTCSPPVGRYGHSMETIGAFIYMFGGASANGHTSELWLFDTMNSVWTPIRPAFEGAMWPPRRVYHASSQFNIFVDEKMVAVFRNYTLNALPRALQLMAPFNSSFFPPASMKNVDPAVEYAEKVTTAIKGAVSRLTPLATGSSFTQLLIYGGVTEDIDSSTIGDIWVFDTITRFWSVPGGYDARADLKSQGRRLHIARMLGDVLMTQGGSDDTLLKPGSPAYLEFDANGVGGLYSYPFTGFSSDVTTVMIGAISDPINGGTPPTPQSLKPSHLISMPPITITVQPSNLGAQVQWTYLEVADYNNFYVPEKRMLVFPANTAWGMVGQVAAHKSVQIADSLFVLGGLQARVEATAPSAVPTAVNMDVFRARLDPICTDTVTTPLAAFFGGLRQAASPLSICFFCSAGSHLNRSTGNCDLCQPGYYAESSAAVLCAPCPAGFFSTSFGGNSIQSCSPCDPGFYQDLLGQTSCKACKPTEYCPAASPGPARPKEAATVVERQPQPMIDLESTFNQLTFFTLEACAGVIVLSSILYFLSFRLNWCRRRVHFDKLDLFFHREHSIFTRDRPVVLKPAEQWKEFYILSWSTPLGGLCSLFYVSFSLLFALLLFLPFKYNNLVESQTLIPTLTVDMATKLSVRSDFQVVLTFAGYGQSCLANPLAPISLSSNSTNSTNSSLISMASSGPCDPQINFNVIALKSTARAADGQNPATGEIDRGSISCSYYNDDTCEVTWSCPRCQMEADATSVSISSNQPLAYAETVYWQVSSSSAIQVINETNIPGGFTSFIKNGLVPPTNGNIFRGGAPSVIGLVVTGSQYITQSPQHSSGAGYLIQYDSQSPGANVPASDFQLVGGLECRIELVRGDTAFLTKQVSRLSIEQTLAQFAGLVATAFGVFTYLMQTIEAMYYKPPHWAEFEQKKKTDLKKRGESQQKSKLKMKRAPAAVLDSSGKDTLDEVEMAPMLLSVNPLMTSVITPNQHSSHSASRNNPQSSASSNTYELPLRDDPMFRGRSAGASVFGNRAVLNRPGAHHHNMPPPKSALGSQAPASSGLQSRVLAKSGEVVTALHNGPM